MERIVNLHIEKLPEGVYLATSDDVPGLVAQGRTLVETLEIARDVARRLIEAQAARHTPANLREAGDSFDYPLVVSSWVGRLAGWRYPDTTIPNHAGDIPEGTLRAILKQAGIEPETFLQTK